MNFDWWTLAIQTVNVLVLVWLLQRFFWRPIAAMIEKRRADAAGLLAEAAAQREQTTAALANAVRERHEIVQRHDLTVAAAKAAAEEARAAILAAARQEADDALAAARVAIDKERVAVEKQWAERAGALALQISQQLVGRLDSATIQGAFLNDVLQQIGTLPESTRHAVAAQQDALELVSAAPIQLAEQHHYRELIMEALGRAGATITFKTDPELIAGLELHGAHLIISNSWRADLARIHFNLADASRP